MSASKLLMAQKLSHVQEKLMGKKFEDFNLTTLLPSIFEECLKEKLTFWFSFVEQTAVLNLRDVEHENYELNIRLHYGTGDITEDYMIELKRQLLLNTFLITQNMFALDKETTETESKILSSDKPIPGHIRKAIETIESKGIPVTKEAIQNHLPLGKMSTNARMECNKFLKEMEA